MMQNIFRSIVFLMLIGIQVSEQLEEPSSPISSSFSKAEKRQRFLDLFKSFIRRFDFIVPDGNLAVWNKNKILQQYNRHEILHHKPHYLRNQPESNYGRPFWPRPTYLQASNRRPHHQSFSHHSWLLPRPYHSDHQRPPYNSPNNIKQTPKFQQSNYQRPKTAIQPPFIESQNNHSKSQESESYVKSHVHHPDEEEYSPTYDEANSNREDSYHENNHTEENYGENIGNSQTASHEQSNQHEANTHNHSSQNKLASSGYHNNDRDNVAALPKRKYVLKVNLYLHKYRGRRNDAILLSSQEADFSSKHI